MMYTLTRNYARRFSVLVHTMGRRGARLRGAQLGGFSTHSDLFSTQSRPSLPKLPVPQLRNTVNNFIRFSRALQDDRAYQNTIEVANKFMNSRDAEQMQNYLEERASNMDNWLTPWWIEKAYLESRAPLPVVTNPGVIFPKWNYLGLEGQLEIAAKVAQAALKYHISILQDDLAHERAGDDALDMSQYKNMFGSCRVPHRNKDRILYGHQNKTASTHFVVIRNGHLFRVPAFDCNGALLSIGQLKEALHSVVPSSEQVNPLPVGVMTSENRDNWADVYQAIKANNAPGLASVEEALFVLCIDKKMEHIEGVSSLDLMSLQALHGGGCSNNSHNRWFDKTLQLIIGTDGCGVNYEHTPIEGPPVAALMDYVCDQFDNETLNGKDATGSIEPPSAITFDVGDNEATAIHSAKLRIDKVSSTTDLVVYTFAEYGKDFVKHYGLSPDSYVQLAMQLAYYRIHRRQAPTYETASLRRFKDGRTDTIRLPSLESAMFTYEMVESDDDNDSSTSQLAHMLKYAVEHHKHYSVKAMLGKGMDRHLMGLRLAASKLDIDTPHLFNTDAYQAMMNFTLSTSQVPTRHFIAMCYGPSSNDCYGVCYNPQPKQMHFSICTLREGPDTSSSRFARELEHSLMDMHDLLKKALDMYRSKI